MDHNKLWKILKELGIKDNFTCLLRNLNGGQEATVWTGHGTTDWFKIGKGVSQGCIWSPCLFNLCADCVCVCVCDHSVTQSCPILCDHMNCSSPGLFVHGILQVRIIEWIAIPFCKGSFWLGDWTQVSCTAGRFFTIWATREAPGSLFCSHNYGNSVLGF